MKADRVRFEEPIVFHKERLKKGVLIVLFTGCSFLLPCARHSKVEDVLPERGSQPCLSRRLFFFGFFPSPSATHAILAESTSWKELGSDMYDMELQRELAVFLLRLFRAEGWNDDMLGAWIRETSGTWKISVFSWVRLDSLVCDGLHINCNSACVSVECQQTHR